ncbi:hypothetical protein TARUN_9519 [Trichoderma arundinaceum]|uniref:Uncharacterized protein n=1 Tax=Trichoderma arundinaceum TaxID=490622 RepID=A0A395N9Q2_TRIAR|nr:hypothetical protein TARUN_9519 [Trichoderma arundinaceum]
MTSITNLPPRYEIRSLELKHHDWAKAIVALSNVYNTTVWTASCRQNLTRRTYDTYKSMTYLIQHQIESGHSLGVFDKEYKFKRSESVATGGNIYWNLANETADAKDLLEQMDFPLVSVAMAYDSFDPLNLEKLVDMMAALPGFGPAMTSLNAVDKRNIDSWRATGPGQVLFRAATSTRQDYEGKGLMKALAHYLMRASAAKGFRAIQIECVSDAVIHVWSHPPEPFHTDLVGDINSMDVKAEDKTGAKYYALRPSKQRLSHTDSMPQRNPDKSFSFVNYDGPNLATDAQVRRRIRQQAMRDTAMARRQRGDYGKHNMRQYPMFIEQPGGSNTLLDGFEAKKDWDDSEANETGQRICQPPAFSIPFAFQDPAMPKQFSILLNLMPLTGLRLGVGTLSHYLYEPTQPKDRIVSAQASSQRLLSFIPSRYGHVLLLRHATDCVIAKLQSISLPVEDRSPKGDLKALMHYQKALKALQEALLDAREWAKPETLCAIQLLGIFEALNGNEKEDSWIQHIGGAARLVEARGAHMFKSEFERALFLAHIGPTVMAAFLSNTTCFLEQSQWQAVIREAVSEDSTLSNDKEFALALWGGLIELPRLFKDTTELLLAPCSPLQKDVDNVIERLLAKRKNLMIWLTWVRKKPIVKNGGLREDEYGVLVFSPEFDYRGLGPWCITRLALRGTYAVCRMVKSRLLYAISPTRFQHLEVEAQDIARRVLNLKDEMATYKDSALVWNQFMAQGSWIAKGIVETKDIWAERQEGHEGMLEEWKFVKWNQVIGRKMS